MFFDLNYLLVFFQIYVYMLCLFLFELKSKMLWNSAMTVGSTYVIVMLAAGWVAA